MASIRNSADKQTGNFLVSVIIPTVNRDTLREAVRSVIEQSYRPLEIVVIGDGVSPSTDALVFDDLIKIKTIEIARVGYPAPVRNAGIDLSSGRFIAFLDDDDLWLPEKLAIQVDQILNRKSIASSSNATRTGNAQQYFLGHPRQGIFSSIVWNPVILSSLVIDRTRFDPRALFPTAERFRGFEDHLAVLKLRSYGEVSYTSRSLLIYEDSAADRLSTELIRDSITVHRRTALWHLSYCFKVRPDKWLAKTIFSSFLCLAFSFPISCILLMIQRFKQGQRDTSWSESADNS
jgi:glycosyltransferase involved in cell wall biosynthesis